MSYIKRLLDAFLDSIRNPEQRAREAWLAESADIFELERRQQELERSTWHWK